MEGKGWTTHHPLPWKAQRRRRRRQRGPKGPGQRGEGLALLALPQGNQRELEPLAWGASAGWGASASAELGAFASAELGAFASVAAELQNCLTRFAAAVALVAAAEGEARQTDPLAAVRIEQGQAEEQQQRGPLFLQKQAAAQTGQRQGLTQVLR